MTRFRVIPEMELAETHFNEWPVWSEHYDFDEIEDLERWGLDRESVLQQFRANERGNEHCVYTMLEANPFPPRMRIFIRATLEGAEGQALKGYVMNESAFCLSVFSQGQVFSFSSHPMLDSMNREREHQLLAALGTPSATLFPIKYATEYTATDGQPIEGSFQYGRR